MEQFMKLLELSVDQDQKRKMGRPPKIPPFSHYDAYKRSDIDFFISLFSGREELYNPCEDFNENRQKAMIFIEKKCGHFLAMRKGRNAEKLWLYLFNDFEKLIRNGGDKNDQRSKPIAVFYDCLKFLIPYFEKLDRLNLPNMSNERAKRAKLESNEEESPDTLNGEWLRKVLESVTSQSCSTTSESPSESSDVFSEVTTTTTTSTTPSKHSDIISCVTNFLDEVPQDKLMLCKVRLFQFIEEEKNRIAN